jgi:hypothetical protein
MENNMSFDSTRITPYVNTDQKNTPQDQQNQVNKSDIVQKLKEMDVNVLKTEYKDIYKKLRDLSPDHYHTIFDELIKKYEKQQSPSVEFRLGIAFLNSVLNNSDCRQKICDFFGFSAVDSPDTT